MIEDSLNGFLPVIGLLVIVGIIVVIFKKRPTSSGQDFSFFSLKPFLLSKAEYSFYQVLRQIMGDKYNIYPKVRMADIGKVRGGGNYYSAFNRITSKHIDFVICDNKAKILLVIELDDKSHRTTKAQKADAFKDELFKAIGLRCVRIEAKQSYHTEEVKLKLWPPKQDAENEHPVKRAWMPF